MSIAVKLHKHLQQIYTWVYKTFHIVYYKNIICYILIHNYKTALQYNKLFKLL